MYFIIQPPLVVNGKRGCIYIDCYITKGNVHDSQSFINICKYIKIYLTLILKLCSGFRIFNYRYNIDNNIFGVFRYRRYGTTESRKEHVERSFADSKQSHGYRYATYRGLKKNQNYTWFIALLET